MEKNKIHPTPKTGNIPAQQTVGQTTHKQSVSAPSIKFANTKPSMQPLNKVDYTYKIQQHNPD